MQCAMNKGKPPLLCHIFYYAFYTRGLFRSERSTGTALCRLCRQVQRSDRINSDR